MGIDYTLVEDSIKAKKYTVAWKAALDLAKQNPTDSKSGYLVAKSVLLATKVENLTDEKYEQIFGFIGNALDLATKIEEVAEYDIDFNQTIEQYENDNLRRMLKGIVKNPSLNDIGYFRSKPNFPKLKIYLAVTINNNENVKTLLQDKKLSDVEKELGLSYKEVLTEQKLKKLEYDSMKKVFEEAQAYVEQNNDGNGEYIKLVAQNGVERLLVANLYINNSCEKDDETPDKVRVERLKTNAQILDYLLKTKIYPNGREMSLYQGDRVEYINDLKNMYEEIQKIDSGFVAPSLPSDTAYVSGDSSNESSGGCYVATCVYGSYDCPQVWTLRRYRDETLSSTWFGRLFIKTYYAVSPTIVRWFGETEWFKHIWKGKLDKMVERLQSSGVESTPYEDRSW